MITIIEEFLSADDLFKLISLSSKIYTSGDYVLRTNASWTTEILGNSFPIINYKIEDTEILEMLQNKFTRYEIKSASFFYFTEHSFIPWHDDGGHDAAMTIYLSSHDENDGGYFLYKEEDELRAIAPKQNRAVLQENSVRHATTAVHSRASLRKTLQIFCKKT